MSQLADSNISVVNDVFIKQMVFPYAGYTVMTHAHVYDHQTLLAVGSLRLTSEGRIRDFTAPAIVIITAGTHHGMQALQDGTIAYCIHAIKGGMTIDEAQPLVQGFQNTELARLA